MSSKSVPFRPAPLVASLSIALALTPASLPVFAVEVQNCGDGGLGSGSLRDAIANAAPGETIDLTHLPTSCGTADSVITLSNGEIVVSQDALTLKGPAPGNGSVTIVPQPGHEGRIFNHTGGGLLTIDSLTVANGNLQAGASDAHGGCIASAGSLFLENSNVLNCLAEGDSAYGGGVYAGKVTMIASTVSGNKAIGDTGRGSGGGVLAGGFFMKYSTLSQNTASTFGGGLYTKSTLGGVYTTIKASTVDHNTAEQCGGGALYTGAGITVSNATFSENTATKWTGGLCASAAAITLRNSTIMFNIDQLGYISDHAGGARIDGTSSTSFILDSTIVAKNSSSAGIGDLYVDPLLTISGHNNFVNATNLNPAPGLIILSGDPKVNQLELNGGRTRTHALLPDSLAIRAGNNAGGATTDQRGRGYPRASGPNTLVDIGAFQFDSIFYSDFEF